MKKSGRRILKCPYCGKIIWLKQRKIYTNALDGEKVYHDKCYWEKKEKENKEVK